MIHWKKPDIDNFEKGFYDSLKKLDQQIGQLSGLGKFYVDVPANEGWIEVHLDQPVYDPFGRYSQKKEIEMSNKDWRSLMDLKSATPAWKGNANNEYAQVNGNDKDWEALQIEEKKKAHKKDLEIIHWATPKANSYDSPKLNAGIFDEMSQYAKVDVNDKQAMDKIKELAAKRKHKK